MRSQNGLAGGTGHGPDDQRQDRFFAWWKDLEEEQARILRLKNQLSDYFKYFNRAKFNTYVYLDSHIRRNGQ